MLKVLKVMKKKNQVDPEFPTGALPLYFAKISRNAHELGRYFGSCRQGVGGGGGGVFFYTDPPVKNPKIFASFYHLTWFIDSCVL